MFFLGLAASTSAGTDVKQALASGHSHCVNMSFVAIGIFKLDKSAGDGVELSFVQISKIKKEEHVSDFLTGKN